MPTAIVNHLNKKGFDYIFPIFQELNNQQKDAKVLQEAAAVTQKENLGKPIAEPKNDSEQTMSKMSARDSLKHTSLNPEKEDGSVDVTATSYNSDTDVDSNFATDDIDEQALLETANRKPKPERHSTCKGGAYVEGLEKVEARNNNTNKIKGRLKEKLHSKVSVDKLEDKSSESSGPKTTKRMQSKPDAKRAERRKKLMSNSLKQKGKTVSGFESKANAEKMQMVESNRLIEVTKIKCDYCEEISCDGHAFKTHMEEKHGYFVPEYECRDCYTAFNTSRYIFFSVK